MVEHWTLNQIHVVLNSNPAGTEGNVLELDILPPHSTGENPGTEGSTPTLLNLLNQKFNQ